MKKILMLSACALLFFQTGISAKDLGKSEVLVSQGIEQKQDMPAENNEINISSADFYAKGMHLTAYAAASGILKSKINDLLDTTELNAVVIDVKEIDGNISIKNVFENRAFSTQMPSVEPYLKQIKEKGFYAIARIVVFRDNVMPRKMPELAVKTPDGKLWEDYKKLTWLNPYKQQSVDYILDLAEKTADLGFDEIQFDYIRFPSDGNLKTCRYGVNHSSVTASAAIVDFLKQAKQRLAPKGVKISIDVFGLTTTEKSDMGIGQKIVEMVEHVDYVSPMIYPSHYANGEYGIPNPNKEPYRTVYIALQGAKKRLPVEKIRPWLQDFSMRGVKYGPEEVKAQIQACYDCGVKTWLLWNAACRYTKTALKTKENENSYKKTPADKIKQLLKNEDADSSMQKRTANKSVSASDNTKKTGKTADKEGSKIKNK